MELKCYVYRRKTGRNKHSKWWTLHVMNYPGARPQKTFTRDPQTRRRFLTEDDAKRAARELATSIAEGRFVDVSTQTVASFGETWLETVVKVQREESTWRAYTSHFRTHIKPDLGDLFIGEVSALDLTRFFSAKAKVLKPASLHSLRGVVSSLLKSAVKLGLKARNPTADAAGVPPIPNDPDAARLKAWAGDEYDKALDALDALPDERLLERAAYRFMLEAGSRISETLALQWPDVDLDARVATISRQLGDEPKVKGDFVAPTFKKLKANATRHVPFSEELAELLARLQRAQSELLAKNIAPTAYWRTPEGATMVFGKQEASTLNGSGDRLGLPLRRDQVRDMFYRFCKDHGLRRIRVHGVRHTVITDMVFRGGESPEVVARRVGHKDGTMIRTTYGHVLGEHERLAAERQAERLRARGAGAKTRGNFR